MHAIITAATSYTETDLRIFLRSAERHCPSAKVILIVYEEDREIVATLRERYPELEFVSIRKRNPQRSRFYGGALRLLVRSLSRRDYGSVSRLFEAIGRHQLHVALERYFVVRHLLADRRQEFAKVMLTDSRDVFFQGDPFPLIGTRLISGLEENTIGNCPWNSGWIRDLYGAEALAGLSGQRIVCSGVTLGPTQAIEAYLRAMCGEIWRCLPQVASGAGYDQGIHNQLILRGEIPVDLTDNQGKIIATLGHEKTDHFRQDQTTGLVLVHGNLPAIVHQYDRHPDLAATLKT